MDQNSVGYKGLAATAVFHGLRLMFLLMLERQASIECIIMLGYLIPFLSCSCSEVYLTLDIQVILGDVMLLKILSGLMIRVLVQVKVMISRQVGFKLVTGFQTS